MKNKKENEGKFPYLPIFMSIGISVGMAIGAGFGNVSIGMCFGVAIGVFTGAALDAKSRKKENNISQESDEEKVDL